MTVVCACSCMQLLCVSNTPGAIAIVLISAVNDRVMPLCFL